MWPPVCHVWFEFPVQEYTLAVVSLRPLELRHIWGQRSFCIKNPPAALAGDATTADVRLSASTPAVARTTPRPRPASFRRVPPGTRSTVDDRKSPRTKLATLMPSSSRVVGRYLAAFNPGLAVASRTARDERPASTGAIGPNIRMWAFSRDLS